MSTTAHPAQNRYKADLREMRFLLFEQFKLGEVLGQAPFEAWGQDEVSHGPRRGVQVRLRGPRPAQRRSATARAAASRTAR